PLRADAIAPSPTRRALDAAVAKAPVPPQRRRIEGEAAPPTPHALRGQKKLAHKRRPTPRPPSERRGESFRRRAVLEARADPRRWLETSRGPREPANAGNPAGHKGPPESVGSEAPRPRSS